MIVDVERKPTRPYTEYNIFFQLEREYILQVLLNVKPTLNPSDVFDSESSEYQGPPLPSRYISLVLPDDWYIPGKERRRKRRHRKSHGKIGFHELSLKIADAWSKVDSETRIFCACLSDIGIAQYKSDIRKFKSKGKSKTKSPSNSKTNDSGGNNSPETTRTNHSVPQPSMQDMTQGAQTHFPLLLIPKQPTNAPNENEPTSGDNSSYFDEEVNLYLSFFESEDTNRQSVDSVVDMNDDEILRIWRSVGESPCTNLFDCGSQSSLKTNFCTTVNKDVGETQGISRANGSKDTLMDMNEMRHFLHQQQEHFMCVTRKSFDPSSA